MNNQNGILSSRALASLTTFLARLVTEALISRSETSHRMLASACCFQIFLEYRAEYAQIMWWLLVK